MADNKVNFLRGTSAEYEAATKDNDTFYYTTDDGKLYLGNKEITGGGVTEEQLVGALAEHNISTDAHAALFQGGKTVEKSASYTLDNAVDYPLIDLRLYGKSTQDGVPTPDAPVDIVSVGDSGAVGVTVCGKNMLDVSNCINASNIVSGLSNGIISFKKAGVLWSNTYIGKFYYKKGTTITTSVNGDLKYGRFAFSSSNTKYPNAVDKTFIPPSEFTTKVNPFIVLEECS